LANRVDLFCQDVKNSRPSDYRSKLYADLWGKPWSENGLWSVRDKTEVAGMKRGPELSLEKYK